MTYRKKLIEVALPLDAISEAAVREKSIRHNHPSTFHLWWARRPLAACRAVLFASIIDDPSEHPEKFPNELEQNVERLRLFKLIEGMVKWENSNNEGLLEQIRSELRQATDNNLPSVLDPFAGGGSIPLEAQRLGLEAYANDLNPVAVLINKTLIEFPARFANLAPINSDMKKSLLEHKWFSARGLTNDIRFYAKLLSEKAKKSIEHLYPKVQLPKEYGDNEANVIAWLWARTMLCPNPACGIQMPLISSLWLSKQKGNETWLEPQIDYQSAPPAIRFNVVKGEGDPPAPSKIGRGAQFKCLCCGTNVIEQQVKDAGQKGKIDATLIAIIAEGKHGRIYLPASRDHEYIALSANPDWYPPQEISKNPRWFSPPIYGMSTYSDIFTNRQLTALTTFSQKIKEIGDVVFKDCMLATNEEQFAVDYSNAIVTYLAFAVDKCANYWSSICSWHSGRDAVTSTFGRQAIPMVWDFAEVNPFSNSTGNFLSQVDYLVSVLDASDYSTPGIASQADAAKDNKGYSNMLISTDPPYYDNIGYADLSDFFYIWLRYSLISIYPELFSTMLVPKTQELVAIPYRFEGDKKKAQKFFEDGLKKAFSNMRLIQHKDFPLTIYYAFKQSEIEINIEKKNVLDTKKNMMVKASTGWETMLESLISSGFTITGTWPMRTELVTNLKKNIGALASSIVLVCRPRPVDAPTASRRQFINELRAELADALKKMQQGTIAPVDLAQASIGPGMAVYSRYSKVIESDGSPLAIRTALQLINRELDTVLAEQEGEYDVETRWAVAWFEEYSMHEGQYGRAEVLSKAKNASLQTMVDAGILEAKAGKVRLIRREELSEQWQPEQRRVTTWEVMQRMIYALDKHGWQGGGNILSQAPQYGEAVRDLAYRLYNICERKGWSQEALYYNMLVTSWTDIDDQARSVVGQPQQAAFSFDA